MAHRHWVRRDAFGDQAPSGQLPAAAAINAMRINSGSAWRKYHTRRKDDDLDHAGLAIVGSAGLADLESPPT